jgi:hypothetical protein
MENRDLAYIHANILKLEIKDLSLAVAMNAEYKKIEFIQDRVESSIDEILGLFDKPKTDGK